MSITVSTTKPPPDEQGNTTPPDIDGSLVDRNESLAQRIRCAFHFKLGEYFLDTDQGLDYNLLFGHTINPAQAARVMVNVIREEGGGEVIDVVDVNYRLDNQNRKFIFSCNVTTVHGTIEFNTEI